MITWPIATIMIGGIATICLTILRIISIRKDNKPNTEFEKYNKDNDNAHKALGAILTDTKERLIVLETKFDDSKENDEGEFKEVKGQISKLTDVIMDVLKKIKMSDDH